MAMFSLICVGLYLYLEIREIKVSSCEAGGVAGPRGFNKNLQPDSVFDRGLSHLSLHSCPITNRTRVQHQHQDPGLGFESLRRWFMTQKATSGPKCGLGYDWLCADGGPWLLGDWDMSLPMISFTSSSVMSCRPMERKVGSLSSGSSLMSSLSPSEGNGP